MHGNHAGTHDGKISERVVRHNLIKDGRARKKGYLDGMGDENENTMLILYENKYD